MTLKSYNQTVLTFVLTTSLFVVLIESNKYFTDIEKCTVTDTGTEYVGAISVTKSGKRCKMWKEILPNLKDIRETHFSDKSANLLGDYCRNPNSHPNGPWCYYGGRIDDWEQCNVPKCDKSFLLENCKDTMSGEEYDGDISVTKEGTTCQAWSAKGPHKSSFTESYFPEKDFNKIGNKCRNPDKELLPWCYTTDPKKRWEYCKVPMCKQKLNQVEYFEEQDDLGLLGEFASTFAMDQLLTGVQVVLKVSKNLWSTEVQRKTSVWSTEYSTNCQRDLNHYKPCQVHQISDNDKHTSITFQCSQPLFSIVIVSPLKKEEFNTQLTNGPNYAINAMLDSRFYRYMNEMKPQQQIEATQLSIEGNASPFILLGENSVPYAVNTKDQILLAFSQIGNGRVGFMCAEFLINDEYRIKFKDFYGRVFGDSELTPEILTNKNFLTLKTQRKSKQNFKKSLIWNAHNMLGKENVQLLVTMIRDGLNLVVGIKSWAYNHYSAKLEKSEIKALFLAAGIWPSTDMIGLDFRVMNTIEIKTLPLVYALEYAKANKTAAAAVSNVVRDSLTNVPYCEFLSDPEGATLIGQLKTKVAELHATYAEIIKTILPCVDGPLKDVDNKLLLELYNSILLTPFGNNFSAPGVNLYPGSVNVAEIPVESVRIKLKLPFKAENYFVGVFVPVAQSIVASIIATTSKTCTFSVNFNLFTVSNWERWDKWPKVLTNHVIESKTTITFSSSFGGLLSIQCDSDDDNVELKLSNVIRVPMYDRRNGIDNSWHQLKRRPVPWAIVASDTLVFIVPIIAIRNMEDPEPVMQLWDKMIKEQYHLNNRSVANTRREIVSNDFQIKAGYMHAGYPIGAFIQSVCNPADRSKYLFDGKKIKKEGYWGICHEVGHNLQERIFTFKGTVDTTNNIFTLVAIETMSGLSSWNATEGWVADDELPNLLRYLNKENFTFWLEKPFVSLGTYAQLRTAFGWEFYRQIFRQYNVLIAQYGDKVSDMTDDEKIQLWIVKSCELVKMNLVPLYDYWKWPIKDETKKTVDNYPRFFPDDFLTKMTTERVNEIMSKYGGEKVVTRIPTSLPTVIGPLTNPGSIEGRKVIEEITLL